MVAPQATCRLDPRHIRVPPAAARCIAIGMLRPGCQPSAPPAPAERHVLASQHAKFPQLNSLKSAIQGTCRSASRTTRLTTRDYRRDPGGRGRGLVSEPGRRLDRWQPGRERLSRDRPGRRSRGRAQPRCRRHGGAVRAVRRARRAGSARRRSPRRRLPRSRRSRQRPQAPARAAVSAQPAAGSPVVGSTAWVTRAGTGRRRVGHAAARRSTGRRCGMSSSRPGRS